MAHAQKPDFVFRAERTHPFKSAGGRQFSRLLAAEVCAISGKSAGYTTFRGSVKGTVYPLHSPDSPSLPLPCVTVCHHISTGVYLKTTLSLCHLTCPPQTPHDLLRDRSRTSAVRGSMVTVFTFTLSDSG